MGFIKDNEHQKYSKCIEDSIITNKILDHCFMKDCLQLGPVLSAEHCDCIILECEDSKNDFGRIIMPCRPVCLPETVKKVKVVEDSFNINCMSVEDIEQSSINKKYWDVRIKFEFKFKIRMFDICMNPIKVLCYDNLYKEINKKHIKDYLWCSISYVKKVMLYGGNFIPTAVASDLFKHQNQSSSPHALVEAQAFPVNVELRCANDYNEDLFDDIYDEPVLHVFITVSIVGIVRLFRMQSIMISSLGYAIPNHKCNLCDNACDIFSNMEFPCDSFSPPKKL